MEMIIILIKISGAQESKHNLWIHQHFIQVVDTCVGILRKEEKFPKIHLGPVEKNEDGVEHIVDSNK
jgi:hypothetical protein